MHDVYQLALSGLGNTQGGHAIVGCCCSHAVPLQGQATPSDQHGTLLSLEVIMCRLDSSHKPCSTACSTYSLY